MRIVYNFENVQEADTGETTFYGGYAKVNNVEVRATGSDREFNFQLDLLAATRTLLGRDFTEVESEWLDENFVECIDCEIEFTDGEPVMVKQG